MEYLQVILFVVAVTVILTLVSIRKRNSAWTGVVTGIHTYSHEIDEQPNREGVFVHYKTDTGKKGKMDLNHMAFDLTYPGLAVGDRLEKVKGEYFPRALK